MLKMLFHTQDEPIRQFPEAEILCERANEFTILVATVAQHSETLKKKIAKSEEWLS